MLTVRAWCGVVCFSGIEAWSVWMSQGQLSGAPRSNTGPFHHVLEVLRSCARKPRERISA